MAITNQVQTPFGANVRTALANTVNTTNGLALSPSDPSPTFTGTFPGAMFTVFYGAILPENVYNYVLCATFNSATGGTNSITGFNSITAVDFGDIQCLMNPFNSGISALLATVTGNNLIQFSSDYAPTNAPITTVSFPALKYVGGSFAPGSTVLTSLDMSVLQAVNGAFNLQANIITTVSAPNLVYVAGNFFSNTPACTTATFTSLAIVTTAITCTFNVTSLSFPALISVGTTFGITAANLVTFSIGSTLKSIGGNFTMTGMKLNVTSVNSILVSLAALDGTNGTTAYSSKVVNLSGGTSATPTGAGLTAKTTLQGRGCTVTTN